MEAGRARKVGRSVEHRGPTRAAEGPGQTARVKIPGLRGLHLWSVLKRTYREFLRDDMWTYAAALAYHALFALFPFLLFLIALFAFIDAGGLFDSLVAQTHRFVPGQAQQRVLQVLAEVSEHRRGGLLSAGIAGAVWVASGGMRSTMNALNRAYDVAEGRRWWKKYLLSVAYTVVFALLVALSTALVVMGPRGAAWVGGRLGAPPGVVSAMAWLRIPIALLVAGVTTCATYLAVPNVKQRLALVLPGGVAAMVLWACVSFLFQVYVANFGRFSVTYGSVGGIVMLLAYLYFSAAMLLLGAELNAVIQSDAPRPGDAVKQPAE